jgi:hypothetical protein
MTVIKDGQGNVVLDYKSDLEQIVAALDVNAKQLGVDTNKIQTTYTNGELTRVKELGVADVLLTQSDLAYNTDGTLNTVTETINGKVSILTVNYVNGEIDPVNPVTRSVT